jgi:hypothetical protein
MARKLKPFYEKKEDIPENLQDFYVEQQDGKFWLDSDGFEDVGGLKTALSKERQAAREAATALKAFKDAGIDDPTQVTDLVARLEELSKLDPSKEADKIVKEKVEALKKQLLTEHQKDLQKHIKENEELSAQLSKVLIDASALSAISEAKGAPELLLPIIHQRTRMRRNEQGVFVAEVLDATGTPRIGDSNGNPMTVKQLVDELRGSDIFGRAFEGNDQRGTGGPPKGTPSHGSATGVTRIQAGDQEAINANLEAIASGKAVVVD